MSVLHVFYANGWEDVAEWEKGELLTQGLDPDTDSFVAEALENNYSDSDFRGYWESLDEVQPVGELTAIGQDNVAEYIGGRLYGTDKDVYRDSVGNFFVDTQGLY